jgi:hypothetical protein
VRARLPILLAAILGFGAFPAARTASADAPVASAPAPHVAACALEMLASPEPATVAWGARLAAEARVVEAVPALLAALGRPAPASEDSLHLHAALLDALVVLDGDAKGDLAWEDLRPFAQGSLLPAVVVLLARRCERRPALGLQAFAELSPGSRAWRAVGNALARARAPGFAATLLFGLEACLDVRVWTGRPFRGFAPPGGSVPC